MCYCATPGVSRLNLGIDECFYGRLIRAKTPISHDVRTASNASSACEASARCAASRYAVTAFANTRQRHGALPAAPSPFLLRKPLQGEPAPNSAPRAVSAHGQCPAPTATRSSALSSRSLGSPSKVTRTSRRHGCPPQCTPRLYRDTHSRLSRSSSKEASAEHNEAPVTAIASL